MGVLAKCSCTHRQLTWILESLLVLLREHRVILAEGLGDLSPLRPARVLTARGLAKAKASHDSTHLEKHKKVLEVSEEKRPV